jgi:uncharacterized protein DUF1579
MPAKIRRRDLVKHVKFVILVTVGLLVAFSAAQAQEKKESAKKMPAKAAPEKKMEMPKPGPEVKKLSYFVGTWTSTGEMKENSMGMPAGKFTMTSKCEWFTGGYQVVCHDTGKSAMGNTHSMGILSYNPEDKMYSYYGIDSMGMAEQSKGKVDGNNWVYTNDGMMAGKAYHGRYSMDTSSPGSYTFKYETSADGQTWATMMEGKATKAGSAAKAPAPAEKK